MSEFDTSFAYHRVLIIDDGSIDRYLAEHMMNRFHFAEEIISEESAESALLYLETIAGHPEKIPQLIFLDIQMPEMNGFGFLEEYAMLPEAITQYSRIIMFSSSIDEVEIARAESNQFVTLFMNKPLDGEKMEKIKRVCSPAQFSFANKDRQR